MVPQDRECQKRHFFCFHPHLSGRTEDLTQECMSENYPNPSGEDASKLDEGGKSEDTELESLFKEDDAPEGETAEEKVARLEAEMATMKKGVAKFFSEKGRKEKAAKEATEAKKTPIHSSDDVTELFLESKPEAELVKDDLQKIADAKYDGSIIKAWKGETWLHEKAKALSEEATAKGKIQPPSSETAPTTDMSALAKLDDEAQAAAIRKMSDKEYSKWKDYQKRQASSSHGGMLSLSPR